MANDPDLDTSAPWTHQARKSYPYSPSASSTSSSTFSTSSVDAPSSQSSTSSISADWSGSTYTENQYYYNRDTYSQSGNESSNEEVTISSYAPRSRSFNGVVDSDLRQHPRRTQRLNSSESQDGNSTSQCPRAPPALVRQSERKDNFVDSLVGKLS